MSAYVAGALSDVETVRGFPLGSYHRAVAWELLEELLAAIGVFPNVTVDLAKVIYLSSDGLSTIVKAIRAARATDCNLELLVRRDSIPHRVLGLAGLRMRVAAK